MAKRFTNSDKWKKPFIRGLEGPYKLLWFFINDECDHAGIWLVDKEVAEIRIGKDQFIDWELALEFFKNHVLVIDEDKWFIPEFIEEQYGTLNPSNRAHASVISILEKYNLLQNKGLISSLEGAMDKDKDKDKDIGGMGEKSQPKINNPKLQERYPFFTEKFESSWKGFKEMRQKKRKPLTAQAITLNLNKILDLSKGDEGLAIKICEQTIMRGWDSFFPLQEDYTKQQSDTKKTSGFVFGAPHNPNKQ